MLGSNSRAHRRTPLSVSGVLILVLVLVLVAGGVVLATRVPALAATLAPGQSAQVVGGPSGRCLDVPNASTTNGTQLQLWDCATADNQRFTATANKELSVYSGSKCLDANGAGTSDGTTVIIWDCNGQTNQQWNVNSNGTITGVPSGLCLDANSAGTTNGTQIILWTCHGGTNQQWTLTGSPSPSPSSSPPPPSPTASGSPGVSRDMYVATNGSDSNPGSLQQPFATLVRAQSAVRQALTSDTGPVNVWLRGGTYYLSQTLSFDVADSATPSSPVTYSAYQNEAVTISGGQALRPTWSTYSGSILVATIGTGLSFDQLFLNGQRQILARYPNYQPNVAQLNGYGSYGDVLSSARVSRWHNPTTGFVRALHCSLWGGESYKISGVSNGNVQLSWVGDNNRGDCINNSILLVENVFEELDAPGEWFYDSGAGKVYFYPPSGTDLSTATIETASLDELVRVTGTSSSAPVRYLTFSGFRFTQAHRTLFDTPYEGLQLGDWAVARAGAVHFKNTENTSPIYLAVRRGVQYLRAQGCEPGTTICYLVVVSDGQETVEPAMVDALNGRAAPNNLKNLATNNESIRILFCGLSQTNAMTPERTSASSERLEAVWKSMFTAPDLVSFDPFCWQITKGADNASH